MIDDDFIDKYLLKSSKIDGKNKIEIRLCEFKR